MRRFFIRAGHIAGVEMLADLPDQDAIARAHLLFSERKALFEGFEVWDRARVVLQLPSSAEKPEARQPRSPAPGR
jgi:hypothetical protein